MEAWAQPAGPQNPKEVLTFAASRFGCCRGKGVAGLGSVGVRPGRSGEIDGGHVGYWSCTPPHPIVAVFTSALRHPPKSPTLAAGMKSLHGSEST
jgi:hypothetical protein